MTAQNGVNTALTPGRAFPRLFNWGGDKALMGGLMRGGT